MLLFDGSFRPNVGEFACVAGARRNRRSAGGQEKVKYRLSHRRPVNKTVTGAFQSRIFGYKEQYKIYDYVELPICMSIIDIMVSL